MNKKLFNTLIAFLNLLVVSLLIFLPYYLFEGRLFLGGDDTRLLYAYPMDVLKSLGLYSWNNISSLPSYLPNHHSIPFLLALSFLDIVFKSKVHLFYFSFSLSLILGFIYFQKLIRELIGKEYLISFTTALVYVLSPITVISQLSFFLTPAWLIALFPICAYYYAAYIKRGKNVDILKIVIWSILLSFAYYPAPWILGLILPLFCGFCFLLVFGKNLVFRILKKTIIFWSFVLFSQLFWAIPFIKSLSYVGGNDLGSRLSDVVSSFSSVVAATATGNVIYPLLTFYHRQVAFDSNYQVKNVFLGYFDHILPLSIIFVVVLLLGVYKYKVLRGDNKKIFLFFFVSFIVALYFFTVNIGPLKNIFFLFGYLPGFGIFRFFTDKFALGYIFIYSSVLALCFYIIKGSSRYYLLLLSAAIIIIIINIVPIKQIIASPLWTTRDIYTTVTLPKEYLSFAKKVQYLIPNTANIIDFPQNIASYAVIAEDNGKNAYIGTSPFKFFTAINDLGGSASYPVRISERIQKYITRREYGNLLALLQQINVGYLIFTKNIPTEVKNSYLFDKKYLMFQDQELIDSIVDLELIKSEKGNYVLYKLKNSPIIISSKTEIHFDKINPIKYKITIKNLKKSQKLTFYEAFHPGWKIYPSEDGYENKVFKNMSNLLNLIRNSAFDNTHRASQLYGNEWVIDPNAIKKNFEKTSYERNKDGSINVILTLYFLPQSYFYFGAVMTFLSLSLGAVYLIKSKK